MARPTDCTPELTELVCNELRAGFSILMTCEYCNIGVSTYHEWRQRGEAGEEPFAAFTDKTTRARIAGKRQLVAVVRKAAHEGDWRAAERMLAQQYPEEWSKRTEITGAAGGPVQVEVLQVSTAVLDALGDEAEE